MDLKPTQIPAALGISAAFDFLSAFGELATMAHRSFMVEHFRI